MDYAYCERVHNQLTENMIGHYIMVELMKLFDRDSCKVWHGEIVYTVKLCCHG